MRFSFLKPWNEREVNIARKKRRERQIFNAFFFLFSFSRWRHYWNYVLFAKRNETKIMHIRFINLVVCLRRKKNGYLFAMWNFSNIFFLLLSAQCIPSGKKSKILIIKSKREEKKKTRKIIITFEKRKLSETKNAWEAQQKVKESRKKEKRFTSLFLFLFLLFLKWIFCTLRMFFN